jgi:general secretion pathway protein G
MKRRLFGSMNRQPRGFTLVELLVTLAILATLASVAWPLAELAHRQRKEEELRHALRTIRDALDAYKDAADAGRIRLSVGSSGYPADLVELVSGVPDIKSPRGDKIYFLRSLPRDPFADDTLPADQTWAKRSYQSAPEKPEPGVDVFDVKSTSRELGTNGVAYREW